MAVSKTAKKEKFDKDDFLKTMRDRRSVGETAEDHNKTKAIKTTDFVYPTEDRGQWPKTLFIERSARGLPCLTLNRLPAFMNQVIGDHLQNRPQIKVKPAGLDSDQQGASNREGIIRQSEQVSRAKFIIDQAYKTMYVSGYLAHWQINTRYMDNNDEASWDQEIVWDSIEDQFSVIRDPYAKEPDGRDANWLFILEPISNDEFKRRYPGKPIPSDQLKGMSDYVKWFSKDSVTIAIYWTRKSTPRVQCLLDDNTTVWEDELTEEQKLHVTKSRDQEKWSIEVSTVTGSEILEDPKEKPWQWIPVVSLIPPYIMKEGKKWYRAGAEDSIDPQRFYNYWKSLNVQQIKPRPPIVTAAMIKNHKTWWDRKDKSDLEYLPVDIGDNGQLPQWPPPPQVSTAIVQEEQSAIEDIKATMGMWNPSLGMSEQSLSGKAIGKLQMAGDKGNLEYVNSLVRALTLTGDIILDMNPHVHDTERTINVLGFDGTPGTLKINHKRTTPEGEVIMNDMTVGKYRCVVDVGPSFTTQRQEAIDSMVALMQGNPQVASILAPFMAKLGDWPYADRIYKVLVAIQPPNIQALFNDQQQDGDQQQSDPRMAQMQQQFEQQMQQVQQAMQQLQAENETLKQEEQSRMAKIEADKALSAENIVFKREQVQAEIALKREAAQQEFELKMQELEIKRREIAANLELADKKATAELIQKDRQAEREIEVFQAKVKAEKELKKEGDTSEIKASVSA